MGGWPGEVRMGGWLGRHGWVGGWEVRMGGWLGRCGLVGGLGGTDGWVAWGGADGWVAWEVRMGGWLGRCGWVDGKVTNTLNLKSSCHSNSIISFKNAHNFGRFMELLLQSIRLQTD